MRNQLFFMQVRQPFNNLLQEEPSFPFWKSSFFNKWEKVSAIDILQHQEVDLNTLSRSFEYKFSLDVVLKQFDDSWMVHRL